MTAAPGRRVRFVSNADDAPIQPRADELTVVLDSAWTPDPGGRADIVTIRPYFAAVLERHDLFKEALRIVDAWGDRAGAPDLLSVDGVTYWFRVRESLWHWVHERLLWRYTLAVIDGDAPFGAVSVPWTETALVDAIRALGRPSEVVGEPPETGVQPRVARSLGVRVRSVLRRVVRRFRPARAATADAERRGREGYLEERLARLIADDRPRVVALTLPRSYQRIGEREGGVRRDPNLGSVIPRLADMGLAPIVIGWDVDPRDPDDRATIEADDRLLPASFVQSRWSRAEDDERANTAVAAVLERLHSVEDIPLDLGGIDLAPGFVRTIHTSIERIVRATVRERARVARLVDDLGPRAFLMTQEGHRTAWLVAGAEMGVPTFALQHGILYPDHPGYPDRRHRDLAMPSRTFVFGEFERRVLLGGAYEPDEVVVSGSPRLDLDQAVGGAGGSAERATVRRDLGVADGDRMLVVSTMHVPFVRRSHLVHMLEVVLGGPLPGIHLVFKQHPGERDEGPYRQLLLGLAKAGGYDPPPVTLVRDIDLYRLLRAADAHLGMHSTVLTDAVMADTCNLIAMVEGSRDLLGYVPAGVAIPIHDAAGLRAALHDPRPPDPDARRAFIEDHLRPGDASERIAQTMQAAIREPSAAAIGTR
jgi:hypothetical protein